MNENMQPISRREKFLAKIAGEDAGELNPITRREYWLNKIAKNSGGGVTSWNDLTNKPFGEETAKFTMMESTYVDGYVDSSTHSDLLPMPEIGTEIYAVYDGETHTGTVELYDAYYRRVVCGSVTIIWYGDHEAHVNKENGAANVEIYRYTTKVNTIDPKYLPFELPAMPDDLSSIDGDTSTLGPVVSALIALRDALRSAGLLTDD